MENRFENYTWANVDTTWACPTWEQIRARRGY